LAAISKIATKCIRKVPLKDEVSCVEVTGNPFYKLSVELGIIVRDKRNCSLLSEMTMIATKLAKTFS